MHLHVTDPDPATEAEQREVLSKITPWAYQRAPLVSAVCEIYERCSCGRVQGDPNAWVVAFSGRVVLFDDEGEVLGTYPTTQEAVEAYERRESCVARELRLGYDPAHLVTCQP